MLKLSTVTFLFLSSVLGKVPCGGKVGVFHGTYNCIMVTGIKGCKRKSFGSSGYSIFFQVGVVAKKYIKTNREWHQPKHLSTMNNLLCGVPMSFMRKLDEAIYLRLEHQVFYHIRACDPLQRRFYLNMMTRTQALGKPFSWSARDVSRLGLLMAEVDGPALAGIRPEAMSGITAHVMAEIKPENMQYITEMQLEYINLRAETILAKKLKRFQLEMEDDRACPPARSSFTILLLVLILPRILII